MIEPTMLGDCEVLPESIKLTSEVLLLMELDHLDFSSGHFYCIQVNC